MNRSMHTLILICFLALLGCKKEDPNPELKDPIYADLLRRNTEFTKVNEESKANVKNLVEQLAKAEANSIGKKDIERDLAKARELSQYSDEQARYYRIRAERRKVVAKIAYKEAFAADKPWPDPREYSDYLTNIRLNEASRNWNKRVPKLQDRLVKRTEVEKKASEEAPENSH